jgi:hypothetical protein
VLRHKSVEKLVMVDIDQVGDLEISGRGQGRYPLKQLSCTVTMTHTQGSGGGAAEAPAAGAAGWRGACVCR